MKRKTNERKGITLISLVITIVVLLILATVAISIAIDSNGLFTRARKAAEDWNTSVADEEKAIENVFEILNEVNVVNVGGTVGGGETDPPSTTQGGVNKPTMPQGVNFKYVTWEYKEDSGTYEEVLSSVEPKDWYDYDAKQWANIKTTSNDGTNEAYWVWIPRYAYQVPARPTKEENSDAPEFKIAFLQGEKTAINEEDLDGATSADIKTAADLGDNAPSIGEWVVHPAFTFGDQELSGIWVAKFEASSNTPDAEYGGGNTSDLYVNVKSNVSSWRYITVNNIFTVCQAMNEAGGALEGATSADPHMMKNVEWGAVVYLAQSKFGKREQIWINSNGSNYLTGQAGIDPDASSTKITDNYNTGNGPQASTTGNVYGVYDMAGGADEYVAAYVNDNYVTLNEYSTRLLEAEEKYKDVYNKGTSDTQTANYNASENKYGDAVYETSYKASGSTSWQKDYSSFPYSNSEKFIYSIFQRGGNYGNTSNAGVFAFGHNTGNYRCIFVPPSVDCRVNTIQ